MSNANPANHPPATTNAGVSSSVNLNSTNSSFQTQDQQQRQEDSIPQISTDNVERKLRSVIQVLYEISVSTYRNEAPNSSEILISQIQELVNQYDHVRNASAEVKDVFVPREVIGYVEHGRNPDIYTREFVELAIKQNQYLNGKQRAFQNFRDVLAEQINTTFPELREDVGIVLENTGGQRGAMTTSDVAMISAQGPRTDGEILQVPSPGISSIAPTNGVVRMNISGSRRTDTPTI